MEPALITHVVRSNDELETIADEWRHLYERASRGLFSDYDWFKIWWDCLAGADPSNRLHVVTGRRDGRLVSVLPLYVARRKGTRVLQSGGHKAFNCLDMLAELDSDARAVWKAAYDSPHYDFAKSMRDPRPTWHCLPSRISVTWLPSSACG